MNSQQAWQAARGQLQMEMSKAAFDTWVKNAVLVSCQESCFTIGVSNAYARDWLDSRLTATVSRLLTGLMGSSQQVQFVVQHQYQDTDPVSESATDSSRATDKNPAISNPKLNNKYTFESFVVGPCNRLAHAASLAVSDNPAKAYNPLFIYGGVGLGKTHLLQAIGNSCTLKDLQVINATSEEFTNELINSIRTHNTNAFRENYRNVDVLLIDDIQFIAGKESTQEEFFHTFNTLHGMDKQIIMTSDRAPKALITLEERLRSRFEWGLIVDLQPPDYETRLAILRSKLERAKRGMPDEVLEFIARHIQSNIRELEGALTRVLAYADLCAVPITPSLVQSALADMISPPRSVAPDEVVEAVANAYGLSKAQLTGRCRTKNIALPRQIAMYLLREEINVSLPQIGAVLGGRDHSTVLYGCEKIAHMLERDDLFRKKLSSIRDRMYS